MWLSLVPTALALVNPMASFPTIRTKVRQLEGGIERCSSPLGERQACQVRCHLIRPLELVLCRPVPTFLAKRQGEIVVRFGVAWLKPRRLGKLRLCLVNLPGLQQHKPEVIV